MKFIVSSSALHSRLQSVSRVSSSKNSLPILDCFLFEIKGNIMTITGSDGETTMVTKLDVVESDMDVRFCINSKTILDSLKEISEQPLTFEVNTSNMEIVVVYQNGTFSIMGQNADEYPIPTPLDESANTLQMPCEVLMNGINRCLFAIGDDELRQVMNGVFFDISETDLTFVSTDANKLVRCKNYSVRGKGQASFILPKKPTTILKNLLPKEQGDAVICFNDRNASVILENYTLTCRLIEGRYPNYNSVIPQNNPHKAIVDRMAFLSALKRVLVFSSQSSALIKLNLDYNRLVISGQDIDFSTSAEENIICEYSSTPMRIGFKGTFLIDILNNLSGENVIIELADPSRAGVVVPAEQAENEEVLMILMPMMLND